MMHRMEDPLGKRYNYPIFRPNLKISNNMRNNDGHRRNVFTQNKTMRTLVFIYEITFRNN